MNKGKKKWRVTFKGFLGRRVEVVQADTWRIDAHGTSFINKEEGGNEVTVHWFSQAADEIVQLEPEEDECS